MNLVECYQAPTDLPPNATAADLFRGQTNAAREVEASQPAAGFVNPVEWHRRTPDGFDRVTQLRPKSVPSDQKPNPIESVEPEPEGFGR